MKRFLPYIIVAVLVIGGAAGYLLTRKGSTIVTGSTNTSGAPSSTSSGTYKVVDACTALTQTDANTLLGTTAIKGDTSQGNSTSDDRNVSTCSYSIATPLKSLTLLARSAKTATGADSNHTQATTGKPATGQVVAGFGDSAYWDPTYGQLNIFVHNNWYILSSGGLRPSDKTLDGAKAMATLIMSRL